jgi:tripartite-type tricarboxylate transporter receptor subunit TctC
MNKLRFLFVLAVSMFPLLQVLAQPVGTYPARAIRLVVPFAPGGTADVFARIVGQALSERIGQPVVVDNRAGGGGVIAADFVAKAAPDGYTLLVADVGPNAVASGLFPKLPYDPVKDFAPVILGTTVPMVLIAHPALPANTLREVLALARARPSTLNFGSAGAGGISHLAGEMMKIQAGLDMTHVPYKGGSQSLTAIMSNETQLMFVTASSGLPQIKAGKVKAIAVAARSRLAFLPETQTMAEGGLNNFIADSWSGIVAPAGTPRAVVDFLARELRAVLLSPTVNKLLVERGFDVLAIAPDEFGRIIEQEVRKWSVVIRTAGVKPD